MFLLRNEERKLRSEDNSQASLIATKAGPVQSVTPESPGGNISQQAPPASLLASFQFVSEFIEKLQSSQHLVKTKLPSSINLGNCFEQAHSEMALLQL